VIAVLVVLAIGVLLAFLLVLCWRERSDLSVEPEGMEEFAEDLSFTTFDEWSEAPSIVSPPRFRLSNHHNPNH
jgi:hypothetical protein